MGMVLTLNLSGNKRIGEIRTKIRIFTPMPPFWQGQVGGSIASDAEKLAKPFAL
jgi:hypothetical protein